MKDLEKYRNDVTGRDVMVYRVQADLKGLTQPQRHEVGHAVRRTLVLRYFITSALHLSQASNSDVTSDETDE
jgi:hypothetical protein